MPISLPGLCLYLIQLFEDLRYPWWIGLSTVFSIAGALWCPWFSAGLLDICAWEHATACALGGDVYCARRDRKMKSVAGLKAKFSPEIEKRALRPEWLRAILISFFGPDAIGGGCCSAWWFRGGRCREQNVWLLPVAYTYSVTVVTSDKEQLH